MPSAMMADTASPAASIDAKPASSVVHRLGAPQQPQRRLRDDRQRALRSDEHAEQIEARRIEHGAAEVHELAVGQHGFDAEHVMHREAVLQAVRAAGVLGDVAADRADDLARRIGRVVAAERRDVLRDLEVGDARLDHGPQVRDVDVEDPVHARQADDDAVRDRQRAAGEAACRGRARRTARRRAGRAGRRPALPRSSAAGRRPPAWRAGAARASDSYVRRSAGSCSRPPGPTARASSLRKVGCTVLKR